MTTMRTLLTTLATLIVSAAPAFAAGARTDHSGLVVWMFLGFCALIVAAQLIPAALMLLGLVKGVGAPQEKSAVQQR